MSVTMKWHGPKVKSQMRKGAADGLLAAAEHILSKSEPLVPVAPIGGGYLRDSGKALVDGDALRAAVTYITEPANDDGRQGGGDLAVMVHEIMDAHHSVGRAKYLETPFNTEKNAALKFIADGVKAKLR
jgi:hypothetical protein